MKNTVLECLKSRRSVRKYRSEQIKDEELVAVLEAGIYAPTAKGLQDPWIVAVQDKDLIAEITKMNFGVLAGKLNGRVVDPFYGAPTIILVFGSSPAVWANSLYDGALVLGNMMNAAHAIGLGSCWINREREMFDTAEGKDLMRRLGVPVDLIGIGALSLGYADGPLAEPKPRKDNYYRIIK